jgi:hypothetical protein
VDADQEQAQGLEIVTLRHPPDGTTLPSDFDIFSPPKFTMPEWSQMARERPVPKAPSDWRARFRGAGR